MLQYIRSIPGEEKSMKRDIGTIIIGTLFLAAGILVGGSMLGLFDFTVSLRGWWTVFIIVPALIAIIQGGFSLPPMIILTVGVILLLDAQGIIPGSYSWRLILPIVLLLVGVQLLTGTIRRPPRPANPSGGSTADEASSASGGTGWKTASAVFGGQDIQYPDEEFTGASYNAMFGGCSINLRNVRVTDGAVINVTALFGGIDLVIPDNVKLIVEVTPILGGVDSKYVSSLDPLAPRLIVRGTATFGGIEIK